MKCEICHKADAQTAITRESDDEELYVCHACAKAEREKSQRLRQRTRKVTGLPPGVEMSVTEFSGSSDDEDAPPFLGAIVDAFHSMVSDIEKAHSSSEEEKKKAKVQVFPTERVEAPFRMKGALHLEGLHLLGELDAVRRAVHALKMDLVGFCADGVKDAGHVFRLTYGGSAERAKRVVEDILREEKNARIRLREELPRVFGDSLCRALAILKNCRLLSPGELFDILSPLRLAAMEKMVDGISLSDIERTMSSLELDNSEDKLSQEERDRADADRADEFNRLFEGVMLDDVL